MRWTDCRIVAFDTETTGLNPFDGDKVIEFGAVEIHVGADGQVTGVTAHDIMINPGIPIPREASRVSGITDEDVAKAPPFAKVANKVASLLEGGILIAHNLSFDFNFIRQELRACGRDWPRTRGEIDTLRLAQRLVPDMKSMTGDRKKYSLGNLCQYMGIPLDNAHRATHDAEATGRLFVELTNRFSAPEDAEEMVIWADAVGPPPATGHVMLPEMGPPVFEFAPYVGQTVETHPDVLQWMLMAMERVDGEWRPRFPDSLKEWARRYLRARTSGRSRSLGRSQGALDWTLEPPTW
jgi:DNA polymerase III epsilon subunit family exonuclease